MISTSLFFTLGAALAVSAQEMPLAPPTEYKNPLLAKVFLYTYTDGFRHDSIPTAIKMLQAWGPHYNVSFDATEDQTKVNAANLAQYDAVMCVHTTGNLFSAAGQTGFADYMNKGGNFVAIHAASAGYLEKPWAPYTQSLGATFDHHPKRQNATFLKQMSHPSTDPTPDSWVIEEEVYSFTSDPRKLGAKVLFTVDPNSYKDSGVPAAMGNEHMVAWYEDYAAGAVINAGVGPGVAGRTFYSSLGHLNETWQNRTFMQHVMGGLTWTFGSNTTRVAAGLYGNEQPTVHTGATNNAASAAVSAWNPVLGSNSTAPPPPPYPVTTTASASTPDATGTGTSSNTSGATALQIGTGVWAVMLAVAGVLVL